MKRELSDRARRAWTAFREHARQADRDQSSTKSKDPMKNFIRAVNEVMGEDGHAGSKRADR